MWHGFQRNSSLEPIHGSGRNIEFSFPIRKWVWLELSEMSVESLKVNSKGWFKRNSYLGAGEFMRDNWLSWDTELSHNLVCLTYHVSPLEKHGWSHLRNSVRSQGALCFPTEQELCAVCCVEKEGVIQNLSGSFQGWGWITICRLPV